MHADRRFEPFPLTNAQRGIWFAQLLRTDVPITIAQYVVVDGSLDAAVLERACVAAAHEFGSGMLKLLEVDGEPFQQIDSDLSQSVEVVDLSCELEPETAALEWMRNEYTRPFDLLTDRLVKSAVLSVGANHHFWYCRIHHLVLDGYGAMNFMTRIAELYSAEVAGLEVRESSAHDLGAVYAAEAEYRRSPRFTRDRDYWAAKTAELPAASSLAGRRMDATAGAVVVGRPLDAANAMVNADGFSSVVAVAAFALYFARVTGTEDVVLSLPVTARTNKVLRGSGGMISNVVPVRVSVTARTTVAELSAAVQLELTGALRHQRYRTEDMRRDRGLGAERGFFGPAINIMNFHPEVVLGSATGRFHVLSTGPVEDLSVNIYPSASGEAPRIDFEANPDLYDADTLSDHVRRYVDLLIRYGDALPDTRVLDLEILSDEERMALVPARGPAALKPMTLPSILSTGVTASPEGIALQCGARQLTYRELDRRSNVLARMLIRLGVGPGAGVAIALPRSIDAVVAWWSVAKTGAACVPVDPAYPIERIAHMVRDSNAVVGLTDSTVRQFLPGDPDWISIDGFSYVGDESVVGDADRTAPLRSDHTAYLIYTSGSTGTPKGVAVTHNALVDFAAWGRPELGVGVHSRVLRFSSASFDASVFEMVQAFSAGATMVIAPSDVFGGDELTELLRSERVTHIISAPAILSTVDATVLPDLEAVVVGGDVCPPDLVRRFGPICRFYNSYGPTESTIVITTTSPLSLDDAITIGSPVQGAHLMVLDRWLRPVPVGVAGELYLGGPGLAQGYHARSALTAASFVADPLGGGTRLYRTGDIVRWTPELSLEYVGRSDFQVQVNGLRIELGEIDAVLAQHESIDVVVTMARGTVYSYVKIKAGYSLDEEALTAHASRFLPAHMVPSQLVPLVDVPLTPAGKIDRQALPEPELRSADQNYRAPSGPVERIIADAAASVLGIERVGVDDSFFALGGDSIVAISLVSRAKSAGVVFTPRDVFERKTVARLAEIARPADESVVLDELPGGGVGFVPLTPIATEILGTAGSIDAFYQAVSVSVPAGVNLSRLVATLQVVVDRHDALRACLLPDHSGLDIAPTCAVDTWVRRTVTDAAPGNPEFEDALTEATADAASRLDPYRGVTVQMVWLDSVLGSGRLVIVIHHLVVDGVSWRILLPDFAAAWQQIIDGGTPVLMPVGTSLRRWSHGLADVSPSAEIEYWREVLDSAAAPCGSRPLDAERDRGSSLRRVRIDIDHGMTDHLLRSVPSHYRSGVNDGLLSALALAIRTWSGSQRVLVALEGHGRDEDVLPGADLSRTVGWFTAVYPVRMDLTGLAADVPTVVKSVKEQLRATPGSGIGYGLLRRAGMLTGPEPQIGFNYLGKLSTAEFSDELRSAGWIPDAGIDLNNGSGSDLAVSRAIDINAAVVDGPHGEYLSATFAFPEGIFEPGAVEELAQSWRDALEKIVASVGDHAGLTPSDVPLVSTSQDEIELWEKRFGHLEDIWSLSPLQAGFQFHAGLTADTVDVYTGQIVLSLAGIVDSERLHRSLSRLFERHAALRTAFVYDSNGVAAQLVLDSVTTPWREVLGGDPRAVAERERTTPFDLTTPPLLRAVLVREGSDSAHLIVTNHHILFDGWSMPLLVRDLLSLYAADASLSAPARSYRTYLDWLAEQDNGEALERWTGALAGADEPTLIAPHRAESSVHAVPVDVDVPLEASSTEAVVALAKRTGVTVNTVVQTAWGLLLGGMLGRDDVVFGATVSGRPASLTGVEDILGLFINTVPVRVRVDPDGSVSELLEQVQSEQVRLLDSHHVGLAEVQSAVGAGAVFDTLTVFESYPVDRSALESATDIAGMRITGIEVADATHYPLALVTVLEPSLRLTIEYAPDAMDHDATVRLGGRLASILAAMTDESVRIRDIDSLGDAERRLVLDEWNNTSHPVVDATLLDLIFADADVADMSGAAMTFGDATVSYREFRAQVNSLARHLVDCGVGPESLVAIALQRSAHYVVAVHAVIAAGGAYLPIDPKHPGERIRHVLDIGAPSVVLSMTADAASLPAEIEPVLLDEIDLSGYSTDRIEDVERLGHVSPDHVAYVMFTSGSTGKPKGVAVSHRAIVNRLLWMQHQYPLSPRDVVLHKTPATFDVSVWELFWPFVTGSRLVVAEPDGHRDARYLSELIAREGVTTLHFVPSMLDVFLVDGDLSQFESVRRVFASGEALPRATVSRFHERIGADLHNLYGPTEAAVDVTFHETDSAATGPVPIGAPVWNTRTYVLDQRLTPSPIGVPGELYLAGVQLARGYVDRPDLTADRFVANPFGTGRLYRTGDLVMWNARGEIEYLGRTDFQVKLRGQRLELGEIDAVLVELTGVLAAVTVVHEDRLVAYVTAESATDTALLADHARAKLPTYMVPSVFVILSSMPLGPNGKLDRRALPEPDVAAGEYVAPSSESEKAIAAIFSELLGVDRIGVTADYFVLGGNSLTATRAVARINSALGSSLGVRELFDAPTVGALAELVADGDRPTGTGLAPRQRPERIPLSPAQQRMWFLNRFDPESGAYNIAAALSLSGDLNVQVLHQAISDVVDRHEVLRTLYPDSEQGPYQRILDEVPVDLEPVDVSDPVAVISEVVGSGFDVTTEVPVRVALLRSSGREHVLALVVHHISGDGWSMQPLAADVMTAYASRLAGEAPQWTPLSVHYADYTLWKIDSLGDEDDPRSEASRQIDYWRGALANVPTRLDFPTDRTHPPVASYRGGTVSSAVSAQTYSAVETLARSTRSTPFMVLHSALSVLLSRMAGETDIAIGTPVSGRGDRTLDNLVGMFVGTVVLRTQVDPAATFRALLETTRNADLSAFAHADIPFERLVEVLDPPRSSAHHPLFQVVLATGDIPTPSVQLPGLTVSQVALDARISKFDLQLDVSSPGPDGSVTTTWTYAVDIFDEPTVREIAARFAAVLDTVVAEPESVVGDLDLRTMPEIERQEAADTVALAELTLPEILAAGVSRSNGGSALLCGDLELSYDDVDRRTNRWARALVAQGIGPESVVAIAIPRSATSVLATWAVAKTGAAFVPVDPSYPAERIEHMLTDSGAVLTLTDDVAVSLDRADVGDARLVDSERTSPIRMDNTAYVIYTSGSTGVPKGVAVSHAGLAALVGEQVRRYGLDNRSRTMHFASPSFDASVLELAMAVGVGAAMLVVPTGVYGGAELADLMRASKITHAFVTPAALATVEPADVPDLGVVIVGGEACDAALAALWAPTRKMFNAYGPTESTVMATLAGPMSATDRITIGGPVVGTVAHVLDSRLRPVPDGVTGELYLSGRGLARGYHRRGDLTAARFVADPARSGLRMYRTGDLVRRRGTELEYLGRSDSQVKIRGFRIELGEIDAVLAVHAGVRTAVTTAHQTDGLHSYVVGEHLDPEEVRTFVSNLLPAHMIPDSVIVVEEIPLTPAGKVDYRALPAPTMHRNAFVAPVTKTETLISRIFGDVLDVDQVSVVDDFFDLGGNSLSATRVMGRVGTELSVTLPVRVLFDARTVAALAAAVDGAHCSTRLTLTAGPRPDRIPLSPAQSRMWILNRYDPTSPAYNIPLVLRLRGQLDSSALREALSDILLRHESLRTIFPEDAAGPYQSVLGDADIPFRRTVVSPEQAADLIVDALSEGFDVTREIPLRVNLFELSADEHILTAVVHHIAADGASVAPLARDLVLAYSARRSGAEPSLTPLVVQYPDYSVWQHQVLGSESDRTSVASRQAEYWRDQLAGAPELLELPTDFPRPAIASLRGASTELVLTSEMAGAVKQVGRTHGATPFMVLHAALAVLLSNLAATDDVVIGTPISGRGEPGLDDVVGMFVGTVALRSRLTPAMSFLDLLAQVRATDLAAFENADLPFERLIDILQPPRSQAHAPIFQVALSQEQEGTAAFALPGLEIEAVDNAVVPSKFDIQVTMVEHADSMNLTWIYATDLFAGESVDGFAERFHRILAQIVEAPDTAVADIDVLAEDEYTRLTSVFGPPAPTVRTLADLLTLHSESESVAIVSESCVEMTYSELDLRSSQLARLLIERGTGPETAVAVSLPRSAESILALWAVAKTGATYVPVDPTYPDERIAHMLRDSGARAVVTDSVTAPTLPNGIDTIEVDDLDLDRYFAGKVTDVDRIRPLHVDQVAYLIYTSGSTGLPKGVAVTHRGLSVFSARTRTDLAVSRDSRVLRLSSASFDASMFEMILAFTAGATMVVAPPTVIAGDELTDLIRRHHITHVVTAPAAMTTVDATTLADLETVVLGGDVFPPQLLDRFHDTTRLFNSYGPTESTIVITKTGALPETVALFGDGVQGGDRSLASVTIGTPLEGAHVLVLDSALNPVPVGVRGELYLSGPGLARGYHRREGLTAERFVANPFGAPGARMYRTGDVVTWTGQGELAYCGRSDAQVQLRGLRIELGEIESALASVRGVIASAATVHRHDSLGDQLVGYVTVTGAVSAEHILDAVAAVLPRASVPTAVVLLDSLPLTPAGKLDRAALPVPAFIASATFRAPTTLAEIRVASAFADVLGTDTVGAEDSFFELGGNSLSATRAIARVNASFGVKLGVRALFEAPSVAELALLAGSAERDDQPRLEARPRPERIPLSPAQTRMWFLNRFDAAAATDNLPLALRLSGTLDASVLALALRDVVERHESLRTYYPDTADGPRQEILSASSVDLDLVQHDVTDAEALERLFALAGAGFDVTTAVPLRTALYRISETEHVLAVVMHHIASDGSSLGPLAADVMGAYVSRSTGDAPQWEPLPVQYADYALWQHDLLGTESEPSGVAQAQIQFWTSTLAGIPDQLNLPTDRQRPARQSYRGKEIHFTIGSDTADRLRDLAAGSGSSLFMVVHAAFAVLLARLGDSADITIGSPIAGRGHESLDALVGMFVNTLALRTQVNTAAPFTELLDHTRDQDLAAFAHADLPFEKLVEIIDPVRSTARHPLFQVALSFQNLTPTMFALPGLQIAAVGAPVETAKFDLHLTVTPGESGAMSASFTYAADLFDQSTVATFANRLLRVLDSIGHDANVAVGDIALLGDEEIAATVKTWNDTDTVVPETTLADLFDAQVHRTPNAEALVFGDRRLTYAEFDAESNRLARYLIGIGVGPEVTVALNLRRSVELVVCMYAVVKAGGAYVPLDPDQAAERTAHILESAETAVVLNTSHDSVGGPYHVVDVDTLELDGTDGSPVRDSERLAPLHTDNIAYAIYTSGSTGKPKGVAISHRAITNQLLWKQDQFPLDVDDRVLVKTAATFDLSVWEYWWALQTGACLILAESGAQQDGDYLTLLMEREQVTTLHAVPSMLSLLSASARRLPSSLTRILCIGEALPVQTAKDVRDQSSAQVYNLYGPTEAAVSVTAHRTSDVDVATVPIGTPAWNTRLHVLDDRLHPVPVGVAGELYLAGVQLARGYIGDPGQNAIRFVADPNETGERLYRTGDLVRWNAAGSLEYLERADFQVKVRGFRIELGEIETALRAEPSIQDAVVTVTTSATGEQHLVGYVTAVEGSTVEKSVILTRLRATLPGYMVPTVLMTLHALPLGSTGKVDRQALPEPIFEARRFRAPTTPAELSVATAFAEILGDGKTDEVGVDDDFFERGGNSLSATRLLGRINAAVGTDLPVRVVFESPTVAALAAVVETAELSRRPALGSQPRPVRIPLSPAQTRMWFLNRFDPGSSAYSIPVVLRFVGPLDVEALRVSVADVIARHEILRTVYPEYDGMGYQEIVEAPQVPEILDVIAIEENSLHDVLVEVLGASFDVTSEIPVRAHLFQLDEFEFVLAMSVHHIAGDGFSMGPLTRDVMVAYEARTRGVEPSWSPLEVQYADYALWQLEMLGSEESSTSLISRQLAFWSDTLDGLPSVLELPLDRPRPAVASGRGSVLNAHLEPVLQQAIADLARRHRATPFMVLHAALAVVLSRFTGSYDFAVGTPTAGRGERMLDDVVGMFVGTVVLRTSVDPDEQFLDLLSRLRDADLQAFAHSDVPFERLVELLDPVRSQSYSPLFQVGLALQNHLDLRLTLDGLHIESIEPTVVSTQVDLDFVAAEQFDNDGRPSGLVVQLTYATDLFEESTASRLMHAFESVLTTAVAEPDRRVELFAVESVVERGLVLGGVNVTDRWVEDVTLADLVAASVEVSSGRVAVVFGDVVLTYAEFGVRVNRLARWLIGRGVGPDVLVGLAVERSVEMIVAMHAVVAAGGAYVPIDPELPVERIGFVVESAAPQLVLTVSAFVGVLPVGVDVVVLDGLDVGGLSGGPVSDGDRVAPLRSGNAAYVMFTSGRRVGRRVCRSVHGAIVNQLALVGGEYGSGADDR
ncbi:amino acid adenylation domain-containing protein [Rhodococcus erythropolis]|uniref:non-ribosomal peptide synthase/polyketide synthase n=1 Tax=Rhodococcus erythropolis TaxID=1833 RepID=UPI001F178799|nr:non-ribosomal peptide synthase/polyketide synthase [Rhodococcus erythropolis]UJC79083.1 amino acid adenylation domain-containing protein [Rhodococcus erythropolis]